MRTIMDRNDTEWEVNEIPPDPVGAALVFTSPKGRVAISIDTGAFNKMTDSDLLKLLEQGPE